MKDEAKPTILRNVPEMLKVIRREAKRWRPPVAGTFCGKPHAAFKILISTVLSLRTKDTTTEPASHRLFAVADTPQKMLRLSAAEIEGLIYPVGFYRTKAKNILLICRILLDRFEGKVPQEMDDLLALPGVGRKVANLVITMAYNKPGICVDIHVHRISNRWGLVKTQAPDETEEVLRKVLPRRHWIGFNDALVSYGQNLCLPVSPYCSRCKIAKSCPRIGVKRNR
jgi:endonuclease-3